MIYGLFTTQFNKLLLYLNSEHEKIDFGDVCQKSVTVKILKIANNLNKHIHIMFDVSICIMMTMIIIIMKIYFQILSSSIIKILIIFLIDRL